MPRFTPTDPPVVVSPFASPIQIKMECPCCQTSLVITAGLQLDALHVKIGPKPLRSPSRRGSGSKRSKRQRTEADEDARGRLPDADGEEADDDDERGRLPTMMSGAAAEFPPELPPDDDAQ
jgi:hypothetical protein